jgi:hypothetical protein
MMAHAIGDRRVVSSLIPLQGRTLETGAMFLGNRVLPGSIHPKVYRDGRFLLTARSTWIILGPLAAMKHVTLSYLPMCTTPLMLYGC